MSDFESELTAEEAAVDAQAATDLLVEDEEEVEVEEVVSPELAEFRAALRRAPGDWFVVHSYAGY
jgi:transcriptional antiterminator NusG